MSEILTCDDGHESIAWAIETRRTNCPLCAEISKRDDLEAKLGDANDKNDELETALGKANDELDALKGEQ
jgi:hypothetical protein